MWCYDIPTRNWTKLGGYVPTTYGTVNAAETKLGKN